MTAPTVHLLTGEKLQPPRMGVAVWSKTLRWADDTEPQWQSRRGGHIVALTADTDTGEAAYRTVGLHHGDPVFEVIAEADVDWALYDGTVNVRAVKALAGRIQERNARDGRMDHLDVLLALSLAMEQR